MQLSVLVKPASGLCNMACRYCFYREEMEKRKGSPPSFMDETTLEHVIRKTLVNAGDGACFVFQGGEPTLRGFDKVFETARSLKGYGSRPAGSPD